VHGDQPGSALQVAEGPVEGLVAELRAGPADQHHVRRRGIAGAGEGQPGQVLGDVPAVEQQAPRAGVAVVQVGGGDDRRGEDVAAGDREARPGQRAGDRCPGAGGGVGDQGQRDRGRAAGAAPRPPRAAVSTRRSARHRYRSAPRGCAARAVHNRSGSPSPRRRQLPAVQVRTRSPTSPPLPQQDSKTPYIRHVRMFAPSAVSHKYLPTEYPPSRVTVTARNPAVHRLSRTARRPAQLFCMDIGHTPSGGTGRPFYGRSVRGARGIG